MTKLTVELTRCLTVWRLCALFTRRERLERPSPLLVGAVDEQTIAYLESSAAPLVLIDICSSAGKAPRIISISAGTMDVTGGLDRTFFEYVKLQRTPAVAVPDIYGHTFTQIQAKATGDFGEVSTRFLSWLRQQIAGSSSVALVTAGGIGSSTYELLCAELKRHNKALPAGSELFGLDMLRAARVNKFYAKLSAADWPERILE